jgi:transcriptional pleiotropic regulator of transition state genes
MKSTGIVRAVDPLGRIVIPKELRRTLSINEGDSLEIFSDQDTIVLRKYKCGCDFCGEIIGIREVDGIKICPKCIEAIKQL